MSKQVPGLYFREINQNSAELIVNTKENTSATPVLRKIGVTSRKTFQILNHLCNLSFECLRAIKPYVYKQIYLNF